MFKEKGLNKESQVLLSDITYLLKEKLSDDIYEETAAETVEYIYLYAASDSESDLIWMKLFMPTKYRY